MTQQCRRSTPGNWFSGQLIFSTTDGAKVPRLDSLIILAMFSGKLPQNKVCQGSQFLPSGRRSVCWHGLHEPSSRLRPPWNSLIDTAPCKVLQWCGSNAQWGADNCSTKSKNEYHHCRDIYTMVGVCHAFEKGIESLTGKNG